ncbi:hypothetical protein OAG29_02225 [Planctomycetaceae bacterium]|nr:hypothetical protein [Planctomycetaceae bacterium]
MAEYWIRQAKNGKVHGPISGKMLKKVSEKGDLKPDDEIGNSADGPWQAAHTVNGLSFNSKNLQNQTPVESATRDINQEPPTPSGKESITKRIKTLPKWVLYSAPIAVVCIFVIFFFILFSSAERIVVGKWWNPHNYRNTHHIEFFDDKTFTEVANQESNSGVSGEWSLLEDETIKCKLSSGTQTLQFLLELDTSNRTIKPKSSANQKNSNYAFGESFLKKIDEETLGKLANRNEEVLEKIANSRAKLLASLNYPPEQSIKEEFFNSRDNSIPILLSHLDQKSDKVFIQQEIERFRDETKSIYAETLNNTALSEFESHFTNANEFFEAKQYEKVIKEIEQALIPITNRDLDMNSSLSVEEKVADLYAALVACYLRKSEPDVEKAKAAFSTCKEIRPGHFCPADDLSELLHIKEAAAALDQKDFQQARQILEKCRFNRLEDDRSQFFTTSKPSIYLLDNSNATVSEYESIKKRYYDIVIEQAINLMEQGEFQKAIALSRDGYEIQPVIRKDIPQPVIRKDRKLDVRFANESLLNIYIVALTQHSKETNELGVYEDTHKELAALANQLIGTSDDYLVVTKAIVGLSLHNNMKNLVEHTIGGVNTIDDNSIKVITNSIQIAKRLDSDLEKVLGSINLDSVKEMLPDYVDTFVNEYNSSPSLEGVVTVALQRVYMKESTKAEVDRSTNALSHIIQFLSELQASGGDPSAFNDITADQITKARAAIEIKDYVKAIEHTRNARAMSASGFGTKHRQQFNTYLANKLTSFESDRDIPNLIGMMAVLNENNGLTNDLLDSLRKYKPLFSQYEAPLELLSSVPPQIECKNTIITNSMGMKFRAINTHPLTYVSINHITKEEFKKYFNYKPSIGGDPLNDTRAYVQFDQAMNFCDTLSNLAEEKSEGRSYRLPRADEWITYTTNHDQDMLKTLSQLSLLYLSDRSIEITDGLSPMEIAETNKLREEGPDNEIHAKRRKLVEVLTQKTNPYGLSDWGGEHLTHENTKKQIVAGYVLEEWYKNIQYQCIRVVLIPEIASE